MYPWRVGEGAGGSNAPNLVGTIGVTPYLDPEDTTKCALKGQLIIQKDYPKLTKWVNSLPPSLLSTESTWQSELSSNAYGVNYKFVVDNLNGTIRLPKYPTTLVSSSTDGTIQVAGNGYALGYTNGSIEGVWSNTNGWGNGDSRYFCSGLRQRNLPVKVGTSLGFGVTQWPYERAIGINTNPLKSGIIGKPCSIPCTYYIYAK